MLSLRDSSRTLSLHRGRQKAKAEIKTQGPLLCLCVCAGLLRTQLLSTMDNIAPMALHDWGFWGAAERQVRGNWREFQLLQPASAGTVAVMEEKSCSAAAPPSRRRLPCAALPFGLQHLSPSMLDTMQPHTLPHTHTHVPVQAAADPLSQSPAGPVARLCGLLPLPPLQLGSCPHAP